MKKLMYLEIAAEMVRHGETQQSLAELLEISDASVRNKLYGKTEWTISEIDKLCQHYNKNYYELFKKEND